MRRRDDRGRSEGSAGAWAAAAVVLGLGGLGFGVVAQVRVSGLEERLDEVEAQVQELGAGSATVAAPEAAPGEATTSTTVGRAPDSPEEARVGVTNAFGIVYDGSKPQEERLKFIDDPTGVDAAFQQAASGPFAEQASASRVVIAGVEFTSAVMATVQYEVRSQGTVTLPSRVGTARWVDGSWKVTRDTVCGDLAEAGATCGA